MLNVREVFSLDAYTSCQKATEASSEKKWEFPVFEIRNRNENIFIREMKRE
nr:MAG TPA: hypothetical protein [Caudoviricetes sp.]